MAATERSKPKDPNTIPTIAPVLIEDDEAETSNGVVVVEEDDKGCDADVEVEAAVTRHEVLEPVLTKNAAEVSMKDWLSIPAYS